MSYLRLKCTKFDFGWGLAPYPAGRAHSAPPDSLTGFEGVLLLREWQGRGKGKKRKKGGRKGREGEGGGRKGRGKGCIMAFGGWTPLPPTLVFLPS